MCNRLQISGHQPIIPVMNVSGSAAAQRALSAYQAVETERPDVQIAMLKKALDAQKSEAAELLKVLQGKGQTIDIRV